MKFLKALLVKWKREEQNSEITITEVKDDLTSEKWEVEVNPKDYFRLFLL